MDLEYISGRDSDSGSMAKKMTQGITKMSDLILVRNQGKNCLEFNEKNQPIRKFEKKFDRLSWKCGSSLCPY